MATVTTDRVTGAVAGTVTQRITGTPDSVMTYALSGLLLLSGDMSDGDDKLLLSGDMTDGDDRLRLSGLYLTINSTQTDRVTGI